MQLHQQAICPICRSEFDVAATGRKPKYCSPGCKQKGYRKRNAKSVTKDNIEPIALVASKASRGFSHFRLFTDTNHPRPGAYVVYFRKSKDYEISIDMGGVRVLPVMCFVESYDPEADNDEIYLYTCI